MGVLYGVDGDLLERQYRNHLSGYLHWDQLVHAEDWLLFEKNIGAYICIDEVALSRGELYTVLINKEAHGGCLLYTSWTAGDSLAWITVALDREATFDKFFIIEGENSIRKFAIEVEKEDGGLWARAESVRVRRLWSS